MDDKLIEKVAKAMCCSGGCLKPHACVAMADNENVRRSERAIQATGVMEMREALDHIDAILEALSKQET